MTIQTTEFLYEPFADTAEYRTVNGTIVRTWVESMVEKGSKEVGRLLDIATGVGTMVQIFLENLPKQWNQPTVLCLDQSEEALQKAKASLEGQVENLELVLSQAEEIKLPANSVDVAMWGNGIHYLATEDQEKALRAIKRALKKDGWLWFNSAFYAESRPPETLPFYRAQIKHAVEYLRARGLGRDRTEARPMASTFLPKGHYEDLLTRVGFKVEEVKEVAIRVKKTAWEHISSFQQYAAGALHGYRADAAAEAMRESVVPALEEYGSRERRFRPMQRGRSCRGSLPLRLQPVCRAIHTDGRFPRSGRPRARLARRSHLLHRRRYALYSGRREPEGCRRGAQSFGLITPTESGSSWPCVQTPVAAWCTGFPVR